MESELWFFKKKGPRPKYGGFDEFQTKNILLINFWELNQKGHTLDQIFCKQTMISPFWIWFHNFDNLHGIWIMIFEKKIVECKICRFWWIFNFTAKRLAWGNCQGKPFKFSLILRFFWCIFHPNSPPGLDFIMNAMDLLNFLTFWKHRYQYWYQNHFLFLTYLLQK